MTIENNDTRTNEISLYEGVGGAAGIQALVARFYALMNELPEAWTVRRLHPEDLERSVDSLFKFLSGWLGGPPLYTHERGHPRLRMRHAPYEIGVAERDGWLLCMRLALEEQVADPLLRALLLQAFSDMAQHLVNSGGQANNGCSH